MNRLTGLYVTNDVKKSYNTEVSRTIKKQKSYNTEATIIINN